MKKIIFITATPIGSLHDISSHAVEVLKSAELIICEDTRVTHHLLDLLNIQTKHLESLHSVNEKEKVNFLIQKIIREKITNVALVCDAGTPTVSDPGGFFIAAAHKNGIEVRNVPGPSSLICALAASGFCQPRHVFSGFLSRNLKSQKEEFSKWTKIAPCIAVFFESPKRILSTIHHLNNFFRPETKISFSREISKTFEENIVLTIAESTQFLKSKSEILGEFVVCVEILEQSQKTEEQKTNQTLKEECKWMAKKYNIKAKDLYHFIHHYESSNKNSFSS